ncbi:antichymotrypsin-2-like isoform X2 [Leptopilina boulardi]|uniref:antichymotrypsin-2-like isoform X2 n=1 Tax=Leptopilina boulardi TaxID=63433 RepID=UPI0021F503DD|nr:antichymotrypsin-2-like isoform X2 [Leptopilina boulardi]XP_051160516.1 antichymotrypsin-2-like isoform X2 [Leptopilina boulardi]XP_051160517.1 antichymotrypsin-2-like isoform X2 [Leptopilina boulardi]XP_051160518.1 antichymotrypsin-2-like isoform X2 [Leptopilina boulardi]
MVAPKTFTFLVTQLTLVSIVLTIGFSFDPTMEFDKIASVYDEVCLSSRKFSTILHKTLTSETKENVINSPFGLHIILSLLSYGAKNETADALKSRLYHPKTNLENGFKGLKSLFSEVKDVDLNVANTIYVQDDLHLNHEFVTLSAEIFGAGVIQVDFKQPLNAVKQINSWIVEKTKNKIKDVLTIGDINDETRLFMINAVYFKSSWKNKFDLKLTTQQDFYKENNKVKQVYMMFKSAHFSHGVLEDLNAKFIEIPYQNEDFAMQIILPNEVDGLQSIEENFHWDQILNAHLRKSEVELYLPKFKLEMKITLQETLKKMGLSKIFQDDADFHGISSEDLKVSHVVQKIFIEVDEEGSEVAAATVAQVRRSRSIRNDIPEEFRVNRPFLFLILYKQGNIPLFLGSVRDLEAVIEKDEL